MRCRDPSNNRLHELDWNRPAPAPRIIIHSVYGWDDCLVCAAELSGLTSWLDEWMTDRAGRSNQWISKGGKCFRRMCVEFHGCSWWSVAIDDWCHQRVRTCTCHLLDTVCFFIIYLFICLFVYFIQFYILQVFHILQIEDRLLPLWP